VIDEQIPAESSAAAVAEPEFNAADQHTWSEGQRQKWNETGEQPTKQETAPAASPAKEAKSEPEGKNAAESETASKQGKKERKPGEKLSAEERISQLTAKVKELEERERSRAAETKPPATTEPAKQPEAPKRPNLAKWTGTMEEFEAAQDAYDAHLIQKAQQVFQQSEYAKAQNAKLQAQLDEVKAKYPDAENKIKDTLSSFSKVQFPGAISAMLNDSEVLPELMYVLSDETTRNNFIEAAQKTPGKAIRALAQMEIDIRAKQSAQVATDTDEKKDKPSAEPKPRAPKPPSEVGGRGAAPEDELRSAAKDGNFSRFEAEMNSRKFARSA
jgi:hypothetical protein